MFYSVWLVYRYVSRLIMSITSEAADLNGSWEFVNELSNDDSVSDDEWEELGKEEIKYQG